MRYKYQLFMLLVTLLVAFQSSAQVSFGKAEKINNQWKFIFKDADGAQQMNFNDKDWQNVNLPLDWSVKEPLSPTLAN